MKFCNFVFGISKYIILCTRCTLNYISKHKWNKFCNFAFDILPYILYSLLKINWTSNCAMNYGSQRGKSFSGVSLLCDNVAEYVRAQKLLNVFKFNLRSSHKYTLKILDEDRQSRCLFTNSRENFYKIGHISFCFCERIRACVSVRRRATDSVFFRNIKILTPQHLRFVSRLQRTRVL